MMLRSLCLLALSALVSIAPLGAQEWLKAKDLAAVPVIPAKVYAQLGRMSRPDVSPDGTHLAYLSSRNGRKHVVIHNLATGKKLVQPPTVGKFEFRWVAWANNERLLIGLGFESRRGTSGNGDIQITFNDARESRLVSIARDGSGMVNMIRPNFVVPVGSRVGKQDVSVTAVEQDRVIHITPDEPDTVLVSIIENYTSETSTAVRKIDVATGKFETVVTGQRNIWAYGADQQGVVRLGWGGVYAGTKINRFITYRNPETGSWSRINNSPLLDIDGPSFVNFTKDPRYAYVYTQVDGRRALVKFDMQNQTIGEVVYRHSELDVEKIYSDENGESVGVELVGGKDVFFNPTWSARRKGLQAALKEFDVSFTSITDNGKFVMLRATNTSEPGIRYIFDVGKKSLTEIEYDYSGLGPNNAPYRTKVNYTARDGLPIEAILTLPRGIDPKNLPTIMLPHGGPWVNDDVNYDYEAAFLANRGYAVLQPNFRGSTGYGKDFMDKGNGQWGLTMQDDITDGAEWLIKNGISDKSRMCIVGGSYGGYAALMGAAKTPDLFKCAASINGVSDIMRLLRDDNGSLKNEYTARLIGDADKDRDRLKATSPINNIDKIKAPILLVHAKDDLRVDIKQSYRMHDKLAEAGKSVEFVEIADGEHWLENEAARITYLTALEGFLSKHLGK
jgi:dipeptidyl aminopeptidase/acylaminoacyl peptidase